jgi:chromosome segregation protein
MAETNSAEAVKALHIAMNSARLILDHEGFRRGEPAISVGGAYWDGNGYLASLGEVGSIQRTIETINDLIKMEDALKTEIKEREARSKNLEREIDSLRSEKIRTETDINLLLEKCKISEKTLSMLREEKEKLENLAKQIEIEIDRTNKETEDTRREVEVLSSSLPREEQVDASQRSILIDQLEALDRSLSSSAASRSELISEVKTIKQRIGELASEIQSLEYSVKEFTERRNTLEEAGREYKNSLRRYAEKFREELDKQIKLLEEIKSHSGLLAGLKEQVASVRSQLDETNSRIESLRARLGELDNQHQGVRLSKMELTMRKNTLEEKLREISVQVEGDLTSLDPDVKEEVYSMLESEMSSMGPVNQLAAMQYVELVENYKSRSLRIAELEKERREILKVIEMIDSEKQELFLSTMKKISEGFGYFFNRLTGGEAWLELSDPEKPNESGVEMIVKFVGKSPRSSRSVSGGEKSVAAVALLMSFQGMTPADFLIFDEVDAHMDASYTRNLSELFSEMSSKTQIIAISLKDVMAERADLLVGVYNQSGESRIVVTKIGEKTSEGQGNSN